MATLRLRQLAIEALQPAIVEGVRQQRQTLAASRLDDGADEQAVEATQGRRRSDQGSENCQAWASEV